MSAQEPHPIDRLATATVRACFVGALIAIAATHLHGSPAHGDTDIGFLLWGGVTLIVPVLHGVRRLLTQRKP